MQLCIILFFAVVFAAVVYSTTNVLTNIPTMNWWAIDMYLIAISSHCRVLLA